MKNSIRLIDLHNSFVAVRLVNSEVIKELEVTNISVPQFHEGVGEVEGINEFGEKVKFLTSDVDIIQFLDTVEQRMLKGTASIMPSYEEMGITDPNHEHHYIVKEVVERHYRLVEQGVKLYERKF